MRYSSIQSATFDGVELGMPMSAVVGRKARLLAACSDAHVYTSSAVFEAPEVRVSLRCRDVSTAQSLDIGRRGELTLTVLPAGADAPARRVRLGLAVVESVQVDYQQNAPAVACVGFVGLSEDGLTPPAVAEEVQ